MDGLPPLDPDSIREQLPRRETGPFGSRLYYFPSIGSTNDLIHERAEAGEMEGALAITDEQLQGRGRRGRGWEAPPNTSLLMTLLFRPSILPEDMPRLVMVGGLAIAESLEEVGVSQVVTKWPNDLFIEGKKTCGLLPEGSIKGEQVDWVLLGMGVNVNQLIDPAHSLFDTATSPRMVIGQVVDRTALLLRILERIWYWYQQIDSEGLNTAWKGRCISLGQHLQVQYPGGEFEGYGRDIDRQGALILEDHTGQQRRIVFGEATVRQNSQ